VVGGEKRSWFDVQRSKMKFCDIIVKFLWGARLGGGG
jgi:hypothetical protein